MHIYKNGASSITLGGETYTADERGIIDVPGDKMPLQAAQQGFVSARGRIAELEQQRLSEQSPPAAAAPIPAPAMSMPAAPADSSADTADEAKAAKKRL